MKYCTKCGSQLSETDKFCSACGHSVDNSSTNDTIKADLKVELTNATTEKTLKAVSSSISSGTKAVKKGTKASATFLSRLILGALILGVIASPFLYTNYQKKEAEASKRQFDRQVDALSSSLCRQNFEKLVKTETQRCVSSNLQRNNGQMIDPWSQTRLDCNLSYTELNKYQDWYREARTYQGTRC